MAAGTAFADKRSFIGWVFLRALLGHRKVDDKSNEITAVPELLKTLFIKDGGVTEDALNCQTGLAPIIIAGGGDDGFALKANHPLLRQAVTDWFNWAQDRQFRAIDHTYHTYYSNTILIRPVANASPFALHLMILVCFNS